MLDLALSILQEEPGLPAGVQLDPHLSVAHLLPAMLHPPVAPQVCRFLPNCGDILLAGEATCEGGHRAPSNKLRRWAGIGAPANTFCSVSLNAPCHWWRAGRWAKVESDLEYGQRLHQSCPLNQPDNSC